VLAVVAAAAAQQFPVTLDHVYGSTTIEAAPKRIVTWGWGNEDAVIALGTMPVGIPFQSYGGGEDGVQPWIEQALAAAGGEKPAVLANTGEPPFEQIAALQPDLIIAAFSGITQDQYTLLSGIAPTIAYSGDAYSATWQDVTSIVGAALGKPAEAAALIANTEQFLADEVAKYPEIPGTTFAGFNDFDGAIAVYAPIDARMRFLTGLGLVTAPSVEQLSPNDGKFIFSLSYEVFDTLTSDILITYYEEQAPLDELLTRSYVKSMPQVQKGALAALVGIENVAAVSPPSALSLRWGFPQYIEVIAKAARAAKAE
jgi:iron complex transport system substrate-binding protein